MVKQIPSTGTADRVIDDRGCDTGDILIVHRIFRWGYRELPALVRAVPPGDTARAATVADAVEMLDRGLHVHHEGEDELLWDRLERRDPGCALHVGVMRSQHARVAELLDAVEPLLADWRVTAEAGAGDRLAVGLEEVGDALGVHLGREETSIVPVAARLLSQAEWDELGEHGRAALPKDVMPIQLGLMLDAVPAEEREDWLHENLPAPIRLLWALLLKRKYAAWRRALFPAGMPALV
ncbi:hemerythrin domain-containing protein [Agromyces soli]